MSFEMWYIANIVHHVLCAEHWMCLFHPLSDLMRMASDKGVESWSNFPKPASSTVSGANINSGPLDSRDTSWPSHPAASEKWSLIKQLGK